MEQSGVKQRSGSAWSPESGGLGLGDPLNLGAQVGPPHLTLYPSAGREGMPLC